jgi:hypothetical protein
MTPNDENFIFNGKPALRDGKDEMNLIEHPFAVLSLGADDRKVIEIEWEAKRNGRKVRCKWQASGHADLGLPRPADERLYLVLMELSREQNWAQTVHFSRADLLARMRISSAATAYVDLRESLIRLAGLIITADNSFYNKKTKQYDAIKIFGLIEEVTVTSEAWRAKSAAPLSSFKWSDVVWQSLRDGNVKTLDMDFALSLQLPLSLRLYRYLDKKRFDGKGKFTIGLRLLCDVHLGMKPAKYDSKYRERLNNAHQELIAAGFLDSVTDAIAKPKVKGEKGEAQVVYTFAQREVPSLPQLVTPSSQPLLQAHSETMASSPEAPIKPTSQKLSETVRTAARYAFDNFLNDNERIFITQQSAMTQTEVEEVMAKYKDSDVARAARFLSPIKQVTHDR